MQTVPGPSDFALALSPLVVLWVLTQRVGPSQETLKEFICEFQARRFASRPVHPQTVPQTLEDEGG